MASAPTGNAPRYRTLDVDMSVSGQIMPEQVQAIAKAGFRTIVCTRPDDEEPGQPRFAEVAAAAEALGLKAVHIPVSGWIGEEQIAGMQAVLADMPRPFYSYCRSGNRSTTLYEAAKDGG